MSALTFLGQDTLLRPAECERCGRPMTKQFRYRLKKLVYHVCWECWQWAKAAYNWQGNG